MHVLGMLVGCFFLTALCFVERSKKVKQFFCGLRPYHFCSVFSIARALNRFVAWFAAWFVCPCGMMRYVGLLFYPCVSLCCVEKRYSKE
jgi:hypothetical protein